MKDKRLKMKDKRGEMKDESEEPVDSQVGVDLTESEGPVRVG